MSNSACRHMILVLLPPKGDKLRCRHCHLVIDEKEVTDGYCPECYEAHRVKRRDFDRIEAEDDGKARYSCEHCGAIITG